MLAPGRPGIVQYRRWEGGSSSIADRIVERRDLRQTTSAGSGALSGRLGSSRPLGSGAELRAAAPPAQLVEDPVVGDLHHPTAERPPRRGEYRRVASHRQENILHLFGGAAIEGMNGQVEDRRRVPTVECPKSSLSLSFQCRSRRETLPCQINAFAFLAHARLSPLHRLERRTGISRRSLHELRL